MKIMRNTIGDGYMLKLFTPNYYIRKYTSLRPEFLKEKGIKLLVCDIDNTLVPHDVALPDEEAKSFLKKMQEAGIRVVFISNNVEERVKTFVDGCELENPVSYPFACKPLPFSYRKMLKEMAVSRNEVAVIGDQLMTDMLGANIMRLFTILTAPIVQRDLSFTKFNRIFERMVFFLLEKSRKLKRGEFDE